MNMKEIPRPPTMRKLAESAMVEPGVMLEAANAWCATADLIDIMKEAGAASAAVEGDHRILPDADKAMEGIRKVKAICAENPNLARHIIYSLMAMVVLHEATWDMMCKHISDD